SPFSRGSSPIKGDCAAIGGSTDAFHYVYLIIQGNGELIARLTAIQNTEPWAKAGIMFRASSLADAPNILVMGTAGHGTGVQSRQSHGAGSSYVPGPLW